LSEGSFRYLLIEELVILAVLGGFLHLRGWTPQRLGIAGTTIGDVITGLGMVVFLFALNWVTGLVLAIVVPHAAETVTNTPLVAAGLHPATVVAVSMVNAVFEEVFVCGYMVASTRDLGTRRAVEISVAVRLLYHTYQGALGMILIAPLGFAFAWYYVRRGRLRPIVIAHALFDLYFLSRFIGP
jgi:membrane protease YdiL (CAAX protease family)